MENTVKPTAETIDQSKYNLAPWETVIDEVRTEEGEILAIGIETNTSEMPPLNKIKYFAEQIREAALNLIPDGDEDGTEYSLIESLHQELLDGLEEHVQNLATYQTQMVAQRGLFLELSESVSKFTEEIRELITEDVTTDFESFFLTPPSVN